MDATQLQLMMLQQSNAKLAAAAHTMMHSLIQLLSTQRVERSIYVHADVTMWSDAAMHQMTRFTHADMHRIIAAMQLPPHIITCNNTHIDTYNALTMLM